MNQHLKLIKTALYVKTKQGEGPNLITQINTATTHKTVWNKLSWDCHMTSKYIFEMNY